VPIDERRSMSHAGPAGTGPARSPLPQPLPQPLCLAGPTASGKTAAALAISERLPVEVVSVDSALVYRGLDIGTAKPGPEERARVPHHLIDIRDPQVPYSAAEFVADARRCIAEIAARGRLPLLVGGTMLYFVALFDGLDALPAADPALRAQLEAEARQRGWPALHADLAAVDPVTAARLAPHDAQRIQRALEVFRLTGQPLSALQRSPLGRGEAWPLISLEPQSRAWLHERIAQRFDAMLDAGLVDEVDALRARTGLHPGLPSMRCVGYRQVWAWREAGGDLGVASSRQALREAGIAATRQLAKRQLTWLRRFGSRQVVACDPQGAIEAVVKRAVSHWSGAPPPPTP
jgi:tRNA dimethylallyltransferase